MFRLPAFALAALVRMIGKDERASITREGCEYPELIALRGVGASQQVKRYNCSRQSRHNLLEFVRVKGAQGLRADVALHTERQREPGDGLVVWGFRDGNQVILAHDHVDSRHL